MGAREKLNEAYVAGSLLSCSRCGRADGIVVVFIITAMILLALNLHSGDIRPSRHR